MDKTYECITFDLWQTLIIDQQDWGKIRSELRINSCYETLRENHISVELDQIVYAYKQTYEECDRIRKNGLDISFRDQVLMYLSFIKDGIHEELSESSVRKIINDYGYAFYEAPPVLANGALDILEYAQSKQLKIGLISNSGMTPGIIVKAYLEQLGILEFFHAMVFSDELLIRKVAESIESLWKRLFKIIKTLSNPLCIFRRVLTSDSSNASNIIGFRVYLSLIFLANERGFISDILSMTITKS